MDLNFSHVGTENTTLANLPVLPSQLTYAHVLWKATKSGGLPHLVSEPGAPIWRSLINFRQIWETWKKGPKVASHSSVTMHLGPPILTPKTVAGYFTWFLCMHMPSFEWQKMYLYLWLKLKNLVFELGQFKLKKLQSVFTNCPFATHHRKVEGQSFPKNPITPK